MMNAFRPWETLFLLVTSSAGWTREALAIVATTTCPNGRVSCPGFGDVSENQYCCPSSIQQDGYYCCNYREKEMSNSGYSTNIPEIVGGVIGAIFLMASALVLSCFFCSCCYVYKYRHRKRSGSESATRRPLSTLGWRYRNWPRSNFVPSTSSACNGNAYSSSSSSRYYYSNRPLRDATSSSVGSHHRHQCRSSRGWSPPRSRQEHLHQRSESDHCASGANGFYRDNDGLGCCTRTSSAYNPYLYEPIHTLLSEVKAFEAPPPYPVAQYYPTSPPITVSENQIIRTMPSAVSPVSTSASAATSTTVIQDDLLRNSATTDSDLVGVGHVQTTEVSSPNCTNGVGF